MHQVPPPERRVARLLHLPLLRKIRGPLSYGRNRSSRLSEARRCRCGYGCRKQRWLLSILGSPREADSLRRAARGDHSGHRRRLRLNLPGMPQRLRSSRADVRGPTREARGQPGPPGESGRALCPGTGEHRPHLPPGPLPRAPEARVRRSAGADHVGRSCRAARREAGHSGPRGAFSDGTHGSDAFRTSGPLRSGNGGRTARRVRSHRSGRAASGRH